MASVACGKIQSLIRLNIPAVAIRGFHVTAVSNLQRVRAGRYKVSKRGTNPLTYEQAKPPYLIGVDKAWNSWNTSNLFREGRRGETLAEDTFIRQFMKGTFPGMFATEIVIKRRHNMIIIAGIFLPKISNVRFHVLVGYTEELLSHLLKCPVKCEFASVKKPADIVFKYI